MIYIIQYRYVKICHSAKVYDKIFATKFVAVAVCGTLSLCHGFITLITLGFGGTLLYPAVNKILLILYLGNLSYDQKKQECNLQFSTITWGIIIGFNVVFSFIITACYAKIYLKVKKLASKNKLCIEKFHMQNIFSQIKNVGEKRLIANKQWATAICGHECFENGGCH